VVGVLPKWFTYPDAKIQIWVTYASGMPPAVLQHHDFHFSRVVARLKPDVNLASALSQVGAMQYRVRRWPRTWHQKPSSRISHEM
jgi:hypothetical protein